MMIQDVPVHPDQPAVYECLQCGAIVESKNHPGSCEECGGGMRNRVMTLE